MAQEDINALLDQGIREHRQGKLNAAKETYLKILQRDERHFHAIQLTASLESELGNHIDALALFDKALALNRFNPVVFNNRGNTFRALKQYDQAIDSYRESIRLDPSYANAHNNLGATLLALRQFEQALECFNKALEIQPSYISALSNRGATYHQLGQHTQALHDFENAIHFDPSNANVYFNQGISLSAMGRVQEALQSYSKAISLRPMYAEAYNNRGVLFKTLKQLAEAESDYLKAIEIRPDYPEALNNLGNILKDTNRTRDAVDCFDRAIVLNPNYVDAIYNKGNALRLMHQIDESISCFEQATRIDLNHVNSFWNKSLLLLLKGRYVEGWSAYEWRTKKAELKTNYYTGPAAQWRGDFDIKQQTILIYAEQGFGDTIQFARYLPLVTELACQVIFAVPTPLLTLMKETFSDCNVRAFGDPLPNFDCHCPLMSLPYVFGTTLDSIPRMVTYRSEDTRRIEQWERRLARCVERPRVGLVWNGGFRPNQPELWETNNRRNIAVDLFSAHLQSTPCHFFSLQKGDPAEAEVATRAKELWRNDNFHNYSADLTDFSETATLIQNLDLVISVDTATAHLAASLGKPTWLLNRFDTCWRWLEGRIDSPWYPSVKLFRQRQNQSWSEVLVNVKSELMTFCQQYASE